MPNLLLGPVLSYVGNSIKEKCGIDILNIDLTKFIHNIYVPCFFVCSKEDKFVNFEHIE